MKSFPSILVTGLAVLLVTCSAAPYAAPPGIIELTPENGLAPEPRHVKERTVHSLCKLNPVYYLFKSRPRSVAASSFCSSYIRPTSTLRATTTKVVVLTELTTQTATEATTTVASNTVATVTELCATPTAPVTCGLEAFGFGQFLISSTSGLSGLACHRLCLVTPGCISFQTQTGGANFCNLFNAPTAGNVQPAPGSGFFVYDRDCTDLLPAGCALSQKFKRTVPLPPWIPPAIPSIISAACTCLITSAPATTTTVIVPVTTSTTTTDVIVTTVTSVQTDTVDVTYVTYTTTFA